MRKAIRFRGIYSHNGRSRWLKWLFYFISSTGIRIVLYISHLFLRRFLLFFCLFFVVKDHFLLKIYGRILPMVNGYVLFILDKEEVLKIWVLGVAVSLLRSHMIIFLGRNRICVSLSPHENDVVWCWTLPNW